ncbi:MAG: hypothetical protein WA159_21070 [Variovorax sp.]
MLKWRRGTSRHPRAQHGAAALVLTAVVLVFASLTVVLSNLRERHVDTDRVRASQMATAQWAVDAVRAFAWVHGRLPCPARVPDGPEVCGGATDTAPLQKGWLPRRTLDRLALEGPRQISASERLRSRYIVYRGSGKDDPDLAALDDAFQPALPSDDAPDSYPVVTSGVDLCAKLRVLSPSDKEVQRWTIDEAFGRGPSRGDRAHVAHPYQGDRVLNVAFGVAVGRPDGGPAESGRNPDPMTAAFESPLLGAGAVYGDVVRVMSLQALHRFLTCPTTMASLDMLATAGAWTGSARSMRQGMIEAVDSARVSQELMLMADRLNIASSAVAIADGVTLSTEAAARIAAAMALLPFSSAELAAATLGLLFSTQASTLATIDMVRQGTTLALDTEGKKRVQALAEWADASTVWSGDGEVLRRADELGFEDDHAR